MKPFNLEKVKAGAPVITRDGRAELKFVAHVPEADPSQHLVFLRKSDGIIFAYHENGKFLSNEESLLDLFMAEAPKVVRWLWALPNGHVSSCMYSEDEIREYQKDNSALRDYTIRLEWSRTEFPADGGEG